MRHIGVVDCIGHLVFSGKGDKLERPLHVAHVKNSSIVEN